MDIYMAIDLVLNEAQKSIERQKEEYPDFDFSYHEQALEQVNYYFTQGD